MNEFDLEALQALQKLTLGTNYVERWQGTPQLLPYNVSTHAYNCAMLYMQLCFICKQKMDARLICALLAHDNMESLTGDLLAPAKDSAPESWDSIETEVQERWSNDNNIYKTMTQAFVPIEDDFALLLSERSMHLLKIIDMLEFLLHAQQEFKAGNRHDKVLAGLRYGGASLKRRLNDAQQLFSSTFDDKEMLDMVACVRYYYNRQVAGLGIGDDYYV